MPRRSKTKINTKTQEHTTATHTGSPQEQYMLSVEPHEDEALKSMLRGEHGFLFLQLLSRHGNLGKSEVLALWKAYLDTNMAANFCDFLDQERDDLTLRNTVINKRGVQADNPITTETYSPLSPRYRPSSPSYPPDLPSYFPTPNIP